MGDEKTKSADSTSNLVDVFALSQALADFAKARNWGQFHSPKNLAMALTNEVGELIEIFQWMTEDESRQAAQDPAVRKKIEEELADVLFYLVRLTSVLGVDLDAAAVRKLRLNEAKYPVEKSYNSNKKYDAL